MVRTSIFVTILFSSCVFGQYTWKGDEYTTLNEIVFERGRIVEYTNHETCNSFMLINGLQLLPDWELSIIYFIVLIHLFLGLYLAMNFLLESIDYITSQQKIIRHKNPETFVKHEAQVKLWNPAIANLTMMVFGQAAPVILLMIIETVQTIEDPISRELIGPPTVLGSAAFNVIFITGVCILAPNKDDDISENRDLQVDRGVKRILYLGNYIIIVISNLVVHIWLFIVLKRISTDQIEFWESLVTIGLFIPVLVFIYGYDKFRDWREKRVKQKNALSESQTQPLTAPKLSEEKQKKKFQNFLVDPNNTNHNHTLEENIQKYKAVEFYRILINEKKGMPLQNYDEQRKRKDMKEYLLKYLKTEDIELIPYQELKKLVEGDSLLGRIYYRNQFSKSLSISKDIVNRYGTSQQKQNQQEQDTKEHKLYAFKCLKYSVSESTGVLEVTVLNKKRVQCQVGLRTIDGSAKAGKDYHKLDKTVKFKKEQEESRLQIQILDNDFWEPDKDFYLELYDNKTGYSHKAKDTQCTITILDDDNPGILSFEESRVKVSASKDDVIVTVTRKSGCKGKIACRFRTIEVEDCERRALIGEDYEETQGEVEFEDSETSKNIKIKLLHHRQLNLDEYGLLFGIKIYDPQPRGIVKISMKETCEVMLILDNEFQIRQEALDQLLMAVEKQAKRTWVNQFKSACMLHPTLNLEGTIQDVTNFEAFIHFVTIGWKVLFSSIPPPHIWNGWLTFIASLVFIGGIMLMISEYSKLLGCVTGLGTQMTGLTILSAGVSFPEAIASFRAAQFSKYADNALISLHCSVATNIFLGFGISWFISSLYYKSQGIPYNFNDQSKLSFQSLLFFGAYILCVIFLLIRRKFVGGELGGVRKVPKYLSGGSLILLWVIYLIVSGMQVLNDDSFEQKP